MTAQRRAGAIAAAAISVASALALLAAPLPAARSAFDVRSQLPGWLAPGGRLVVSGFTRANVFVVARAGRAPLGRTRSGPLGRFTLRLRAPGAGRYALSLQSGSDRQALGVLVVRPLKLAAVGDVTPGEAVGPAVAAHGGAYPWTYVGGVLRSADIATANLEGAVTGRGLAVANKEFHFRGPVELLTGANRFGGLDVVTCANNHSLDYGSEGLADTLAAARAAGILTVGAGGDDRAARRPAFVDAGGLRVAFLGYSDINPLGFPARTSSPGTARADPAAVAEDVRAARRHADVVVVWFHWGVELRAEPNERQRLLAATAIDAGAAVVLGAHPHVFGPIERPRPHALVAWTLGNFVFPSTGAAARSGILTVRLGARGVAGFDVIQATSGVQPELR